jgi:PP-loop superfamily ATP-utilizing enzyme
VNAPGRIVCQFSCGAASAVATKLAIERYGDRVSIINAFVADEDEDNRRFLADCETWFGRPIEVLRDTKYGASAAEVWRRKRFIVHRDGAPCSKALKRDILTAYHRPGDTIVLGYTADPRDAARLDRYIDAHAEDLVWAPLIEAGLTKRACFEAVARAGIELPRMYRLGYHNANCPKCPKGGEGYWNKIRHDFPENFEEMARLQDELGPGSYFFRNRKTGERISLRMLSPTAGRFKDEPAVECGAVCEMPEDTARLEQASLFLD